jgi:flagellar operon protein
LDSAELHLSKHAQKRLDAREIELSSMDRSKLSDAVSSLAKKGARDSLVLMGDLAFIVNVPSKTVVTAMGRDQMKEQIFTNIDSTMLV